VSPGQRRFDAWFSTDDLTTGAVISGVAALVVALAGSSAGSGQPGTTGERTRRRAHQGRGHHHRAAGRRQRCDRRDA
jgi:hypothetical protein